MTFLTPLKSQDQDETADVAFHDWDIYQGRKVSLINFEYKYKFMYYKLAFSPFHDDSSCFLTPHHFKDTLLSKCHLAINNPLRQNGTHDAQEKQKVNLPTASKSSEVEAKIESICAIIFYYLDLVFHFHLLFAQPKFGFKTNTQKAGTDKQTKVYPCFSSTTSS